MLMCLTFLVLLLLAAIVCLGVWAAHRFDSQRGELLKLTARQNATPKFDFPVVVPQISRDDQITLAAFFDSALGRTLLIRLRATLCNMAITAGANKQFAAARASEAHGYSECLSQIASLSVVPTASDNPAANQEDEIGELLNKFSS